MYTLWSHFRTVHAHTTATTQLMPEPRVAPVARSRFLPICQIAHPHTKRIFTTVFSHSHRSHHRSTPAYPFQPFPPRLALDRLNFPLRAETTTRHAMIACADITISNNATVLSITVGCKPGRNSNSRLEVDVEVRLGLVGVMNRPRVLGVGVWASVMLHE